MTTFNDTTNPRIIELYHRVKIGTLQIQDWGLEICETLSRDCKKLLDEIGTPPAGSHPDEAKPRAATWHMERQNALAEIERQREFISKITGVLIRARDVLEMIPPPLSDSYTNNLQADIADVLPKMTAM